MNRLDTLRQMMRQQKLDGLVCRLSQNVLMLSGFWPMNGFALAVLPREGDPVLILPQQDERWTTNCLIPDRRTYQWGDTRHMDLLASLLPVLRDVARACKLRGKRLGIEMDYPIGALPAWSPEIRQFTQAGLKKIQSAFTGAEFVDVWESLHEVASRKTPAEIEKIRAANQLAGLALKTFRRAVAPGRTEREIAAAVEHAVNAHGDKQSRAWAHVMSGPNSAFAGQTYNMSTGRVVREGDLVSLELGVVADGYWSDLTRVHVAGKPSKRQQKFFDLVANAHDAAVKAIRVGTPWSKVDRAARAVIERAGSGADFPHITGHGVGFCYHEITPLIGPGIPGKVAVGQIVTIEPAIYRSDCGGIRHEDNHLVTESGTENLSPFYRGLSTRVR